MRRNEIAKLVGSNIKLRRAIGRIPITPIYDTLEWMYQHARAQVEGEAAVQRAAAVRT